MSFGTYNPNKSSTKYSRFYLQDGSNLYRILPPVHSLAQAQEIAQYWSVIWLTSPAGKKYAVPSILQKGKNGTILKNDPLIQTIEEINEKLKVATQMGDTVTINNLKELQKRIYNKKIYALNVINQAGEVGVLSVPYTSYQALKTKLREAYQMGIDPVGIGANKGLFFDFKKSRDDRGRVVYTVEFATKLQKTEQGPVVSYIYSPITEQEAALLVEQVQDLTKLFTYKSAEEMELLATLKQEAFDIVFGKGDDVEEDEEEVGSSYVTPKLNVANGSVSVSGLGASHPNQPHQVGLQATSGQNLSTKNMDAHEQFLKHLEQERQKSGSASTLSLNDKIKQLF